LENVGFVGPLRGRSVHGSKFRVALRAVDRTRLFAARISVRTREWQQIKDVLASRRPSMADFEVALIARILKADKDAVELIRAV
jgi:hypothetical protein